MTTIKVALTTLGCKVNQDETAGMEALFAKEGFEIVDFKGCADVYVVNTCTVTQTGSKKSRQLLRQARRRNPAAIVVAAGCYPQAAPEELADLPEIDLVIGNSHKRDVVKLVQMALAGNGQRIIVQEPVEFMSFPISHLDGRHRATLKIQEGCRRFCTYCIVPKARGTLRSMPLDAIISKAIELVQLGFQELVLTGINLTSYGKENNGPSLAEVINRLAPEVKPARIRISSVEPTDFSAELIEAFKENANVCRDFHIPLQSGSNSVLRRMGRKYSAQDFLELTTTLNENFDRPSFSTDVIVGFPGETQDEFEDTVNVVRAVGFCRLHVFRYSPRPGTPAASFPDQVESAISARRSQLLIDLGENLAEQFAHLLLGSDEELLVEEPSPLGPGIAAGYGERYMRIHCPTAIPAGNTLKVKITGNRGRELLARQV